MLVQLFSPETRMRILTVLLFAVLMISSTVAQQNQDTTPESAKLEDRVGDVEVRKDVLHVVVLLEARGAGALAEHRTRSRPRPSWSRPSAPPRPRADSHRLDAPHRRHLRRLAHHDPGFALVGQVVHAGIEHDRDEVVLGDRPRCRQHALPGELPRHRSRLGHRAPVPREGRPDVRPGPVAVVGEALDDDRNSAGP